MTVSNPKYLVLRDTREKALHGWLFNKHLDCEGTVEQKLDTGDYTIHGCEKRFVIERKGSVAEFTTNLTQVRFEEELKRLDEFEFPFIILEFELEDIFNFPRSSGIPEHKWKYLRVTAQFLVKRINEIQLQHRARILFAGKRGRDMAGSLMKRMAEHVQNAARKSN